MDLTLHEQCAFECLCLWWSEHADSPCEDGMEAFEKLLKDAFCHLALDCQANVLRKKMEQAQVQAAASGIAEIDVPAGPESVQASLLAT